MREKMAKKSFVVLFTTIPFLLLIFSGLSCLAADQIMGIKRPVAYTGPKYVPKEVLVKFRSGVRAEEAEEVNLRYGTVVKKVGPGDVYRLRIPWEATVEQMVEEFNKDPAVEYAEPNYIAHALWAPNDPYYKYQWHLYNPVYGGIQMEAAWQSLGAPGTPGQGVVVAIVDTGIAYENYRGYEKAPDLANTIFVSGYDFVNNDNHPNDDNGHGTHVAGTVAQSTNNGIGVAGVAFKASLMPVKVLDKYGAGTYADVAEGIIWATDHGAQVINLSLGGNSPADTLKDAIAYAYTNGVTVIAAAGNDGSPNLSYPAAYDDYVIAVGATRYDETLAYYSNYGPSLDLVAPGGDINVDQNEDGYGDGVLQQTFGNNPKDWGYWFYQGTSMAAPHISGVAALLIAKGVATTPDNVRAVLQETAEDLGAAGRDDTYGYGLVDAYSALGGTKAPNNPPIADPDGPYIGKEDTPVTFDGSGSSDPDGDALTYKWDFGDGTMATVATAVTTHTYTTGQSGVTTQYTVTLVVNDGKVDSAASTTTATITGVNDLPIANANGPYTGAVSEPITFDASGSSDEEGIASYAWDFGDGTTTTVTTATTTHTYAATGTYNVVLTVTDTDGATATDSTTAKVTEIKVMHVGSIKIRLQTRSAGPNVFVSAVATVAISDATGSPVEGATVYGYWSGATSDTDSGTTNTSGTVTLESDKVKNPSPGTTFTFTIDNVTKGGWIYDPTTGETSNSVTIQSTTTKADLSIPEQTPGQFNLYQNYPNPFNPETTIEYTIEKDCYVTLKIYNLSGQLIKTLINEYQIAGHHTIIWYGDNDAGEEVASGVYFYQLKAGDKAATKKMVVLK